MTRRGTYSARQAMPANNIRTIGETDCTVAEALERYGKVGIAMQGKTRGNGYHATFDTYNDNKAHK